MDGGARVATGVGVGWKRGGMVVAAARGRALSLEREARERGLIRIYAVIKINVSFVVLFPSL